MAYTGDLQYQVTQLYKRVVDLNAAISARALNSRVNTLQVALQSSVDTIAHNLDLAEEEIKVIQNDLIEVVTELRSK